MGWIHLDIPLISIKQKIAPEVLGRAWGFVKGPCSQAAAARPWRTGPRGRVTHIADVHGVLFPLWWTNVGEVHGELSSNGRDPTLEQGKDSSLCIVAGTMCDEMAITPIPCLPAPLRGGGRAEKEGWREGVFRALFYFSLSCPDFVRNEFS